MLGGQRIFHIEHRVTGFAQKLQVGGIASLVTGDPATTVNIDNRLLWLQRRIIWKQAIKSLVTMLAVAKFLLVHRDFSLADSQSSEHRRG